MVRARGGALLWTVFYLGFFSVVATGEVCDFTRDPRFEQFQSYKVGESLVLYNGDQVFLWDESRGDFVPLSDQGVLGATSYRRELWYFDQTELHLWVEGTSRPSSIVFPKGVTAARRTATATEGSVWIPSGLGTVGLLGSGPIESRQFVEAPPTFAALHSIEGARAVWVFNGIGREVLRVDRLSLDQNLLDLPHGWSYDVGGEFLMETPTYDWLVIPSAPGEGPNRAFSWSAAQPGNLTPVPTLTGVVSMVTSGDRSWFLAAGGLWSVAGGTPWPSKVSPAGPEVAIDLGYDGRVWLATSHGLRVRKPGGTVLEQVFQASFKYSFDLGGQRILGATGRNEEGPSVVLWLWNPGAPLPIRFGSITGLWLREAEDAAGERLWLQDDFGQLTGFSKENPQDVVHAQHQNYVSAAYSTDESTFILDEDELLVHAGRGEHRRTRRLSTAFQPGPRAFGFTKLLVAGDSIWLVSDRSDQEWVAVPTIAYLKRFDIGKGVWRPAAELPAGSDFTANQPFPVSWEVVDYGCRGHVGDGEFVATLQNWDGTEVLRFDTRDPIHRVSVSSEDRVSVVVPGLGPGSYEAVLFARDYDGTLVQMADPRKIVLATRLDFWSFVGSLLGAIGVAGLVSSVIAVLLLIVLGHWYSFPFYWLAHIPFRAVRPVFGVPVAYCPALQVWLFERLLRELAEPDRSHPYVVTEVNFRDGHLADASTLLDRLGESRKQWLVGDSGTGKTTTFDHLIELYANPARSVGASGSDSRESKADKGSILRRSFKRYGFILIPIRLRSFDAAPLETVVNRFFEGRGFFMAEGALFRKLISSGSLCLMLDGANEREMEDKIQLFAGTYPNARLLVTSQTDPQGDAFEVADLPPVGRERGRSLLRAFLGEADEALEAEGRVPDALWAEISSGYDVQLVAEALTQGRQLPANRGGLYEMALTAVPGGIRGRVDSALSEAAWVALLSRRFTIELGGSITKQTQDAADEAHLVVPRQQAFEFRHSMMRSYLAARWVARHSPNESERKRRLEQSELWELDQEEQARFAEFLCDFLDSRSELETLADIAIERLEQRQVLWRVVHAKLDEGGFTYRLEWDPRVSLG